MLTKEQFLNAMSFFHEYNNLCDSLTSALEPFFDGNGFFFKGADNLYNRYFDLLKTAMNIDLEDEYDPISMWLYDASKNIYGEPNENGICEKIGEADHCFIEIRINDKVFHIKNESELYDYIVYAYDI